LIYIKRVELVHFKSFGGTVEIPLLPGFTVVTGPNGSGKSNILDGLLFALGLSSSKGMRADRLPDLVNQSHASRSRSTVETTVSATFAIDAEDLLPADEEDASEESNLDSTSTPTSTSTSSPDADSPEDLKTDPKSPQSDRTTPTPSDPPPSESSHRVEWTVTRKLRVTPQGTYTSTYYSNGEACTLSQLHEQLNRLRIYPEGYNIVLQGDVTGIISMNGRERRQIIDELAGVAQFDRKINQAKEKLDSVKEREESCQIIQQELQQQLERLGQDRLKAEKYQRLRTELQEKETWERVLTFQAQEREAAQLQQAITAGERSLQDLQHQAQERSTQLAQEAQRLEELNQQVKALGEEQLIAVQSQRATQEAELRQVERQLRELETAGRKTQEDLQQTQQRLQSTQERLQDLEKQTSHWERTELQQCRQGYDLAQQQLAQRREAAHALAAQSQDWVQTQTRLRQALDQVLATLEPKRSLQVQLQERSQQLQQQIQTQTESITQVSQEWEQLQPIVQEGETERDRLAALLGETAQRLSGAEAELQLQQETQQRLLREQREKQRQLDKQESLTQALQETQGTQATRVILQSGLGGVEGLVAQLGTVEPRYQLALETAAGGRLGYVVADDRVAAAGIALLKQERAGRATFLPLNKIQGGTLTAIDRWKSPDGFIDYAVNLLTCDDRYRGLFQYIFGSTLVFEHLDQARRYLGQYRMVTLDGELLETSGAMTGGSFMRRSGSISFGAVESGESAEVVHLRERLGEIDRILHHSEVKIAQLTDTVQITHQRFTELRQNHQAVDLEWQQAKATAQRLQQQRQQLETQLQQQRSGLASAQAQLLELSTSIPQDEAQLQTLRDQLQEMSQSAVHSEWQTRQQAVQAQEQLLQQQEQALRAAEQHLADLQRERQRSLETLSQGQQHLQHLRQVQVEQINQHSALGQQQSTLEEQIQHLKTQGQALEARLGSQKQERDRLERHYHTQQHELQQLHWQREKLEAEQQQRREQFATLQETIAARRPELPDPLPVIPAEIQEQGVVALQHQLRALAKKIQAMEPVNMLALEEYDRTQGRLQDLTEKLQTLESERTELLLRIENFTTLRQRAFMESFDAVNQNFKEIFAQLSDGDGYLQLDDPETPLDSGLNLVAHPKGKPVRRLASMSGGEKSLTALSFIFALQRYRPSPFYAFDEVDSFLDGANVERLAKVIAQQSDQAQFLVVSHRRPMIEAAERTIGVTQARGAHTQVLGISLPQERSAGGTKAGL
jgi:chromosome segregation protein